LDGIASAKPELWTPRRGPVAGLILHRGTVRSDETATTKLLRHTTLDRTVLDLATVLHEDALELVIESAIRLDRTVEARLRAAKPRRGGPTLTRVLSRRAPGWPATGSELETRYLQLIRPLGLPDPVRQYPICDSAGRCMFNLDFVWPDVGLWVEMDGRESHGLPKAVFADRHRQNDLITRLPWRLLRFTWDDVMEQQARTLRTTDAAYRQCAAGSAGGSQAS
jgi:hypothetical protein